MKLNSKLVGIVLAYLRLSSVEAMEPSHVDSEVAKIIQSQLTKEGSKLIEELSNLADTTKNSVTLTSSDSRWQKAGFSNADAEMRQIFVHTYTRYGRGVVFSSDEIQISPVIRKK